MTNGPITPEAAIPVSEKTALSPQDQLKWWTNLSPIEKTAYRFISEAGSRKAQEKMADHEKAA